MNKTTSFARGVSAKLKDLEYVEYTEEEYLYIANQLANNYSVNSTYYIGDFVIYNNSIYECKNNVITPEEFNEDNWAYLGVETVKDIILANSEDINLSLYATKEYVDTEISNIQVLTHDEYVELATLSADEFSSEETYYLYDLCKYEDITYECIEAIVVPGPWDSSKWSALN